MSYEKIKLPDFLIADLYKETLVDINIYEKKEVASSQQEKETTVTTEPNSEIKYQGKNGKNVVVVVNEKNAVDLNEEDLTFLTNILKACQLDLTDIAIINIAARKVNYQMIKEQLHAQTVLLFDVEPSAIKLPFMIPAFQVQKYDNCTIMVSPPLAYLNKPTQEGKLLKTKLWMSLKQVFGIS